mmetsp:Transcript_1721/g.3260  ORF Transcript_1721/g.3260 Transcript_1721/m.3260 type:complete len:150 (+) Transcript_1721:900-1349(+)
MRGEKPYRTSNDGDVEDDVLQIRSTPAPVVAQQHSQPHAGDDEGDVKSRSPRREREEDPRRLVMQGRLRLHTRNLPSSTANCLTEMCLKFNPAERPSALTLSRLIESRFKGKDSLDSARAALCHRLPSHTRSRTNSSNKTPITYDTCPM